MISPIENWVAERTELNERLSQENLKEWQFSKIREIIEYARNNSKFYSETLKDIKIYKNEGFLNLKDVPFTTPKDIANDPMKFLCVPQHEVARIVTLLTSGSLGISKRIYFTENDMERTADFFSWGMSTMVSCGQTATVFMSGQTKYSIGDLLNIGLKRIGVTTRIHGNIKDYEKAFKDAESAHCLIGVPSEMLYLCRTYPNLQPESVLLSADYVPECIIKAIENVWNCKTYTHYGMTETGFGLGVQCDSSLGYHLRDADFILEIIDPDTGEYMENGKFGEVVITTLNREAMPLIRYRTGDISRIINKACSCGGILPQLDKVKGRFENIIRLYNGNYISIHELDEIVFEFPQIRNYIPELTFEDENNILYLKVDTIGSLNEECLVAKLKENFGDIKIKIIYGEYPYYVCNGKRKINII